MRQRWLVLMLLVGLLLSVSPVAADKRIVDPSQEPEISLDEAEAAKLAQLQNYTFPSIASRVSPDDSTIFTVAYARSGDVLLQFVNVNTGAMVRAGDQALALGPLSEIAWVNERTIRYVSLNTDLNPVLVDIDSRTGAVVTQQFDLPGFPFSLAPNAARLLIVLAEEVQNDTGDTPDTSRLKTLERGQFRLKVQSPFNIVVKKAPFKRPGPAIFDYQDNGQLQVSSIKLTLASLDLNTGELIPLSELPEGTGPVSQPQWSDDGSKLTLVRTTVPVYGRGGTPLANLTTQDTLGKLPPQDNPFLLGNVVDTYDFATGDYRPAALRAVDGNGDMYADARWSPDGQTLLTKMQRPSRLVGRANPIYLYPESAYYRFYDANLQELLTFDRPETSARYTSVATWASPDELIFTASVGLTYRLYYYNRVSGEFRPISIEEGTYYQIATTRQSRQVIYSFSSFEKPYDIYRIGWDGQALAGLTYFNYNLRPLNQIRADFVQFRLKNGAIRSGFLIQPAGAAFPPQNVPIVAWQQGGPGGTITNEWGSIVEQPYNLLPNFGVAVLVTALPGREGFGPQFLNDLANGTNFGQIDIDEQAEIMQQLIDRGYTAPGKIGITGCSYGGYFTTQSIARYPNLYAAANSQCSLVDLFVEYQFGYTPLISYLEGQPPTTNPAEYASDSPLYNTARVRTPTLLFHGELDFLPFQQVETFHDQLQANGTPVELIGFAGEGHGLGAATSQFEAGQAQIEWFRQYLNNAPADQ